MGQCQYCARANFTSTDTNYEKAGTSSSSPKVEISSRIMNSDTCQDSGNSSEDEAASCGGKGTKGGGGVRVSEVGVTVECPGRVGSHSSDSSGKYSMRDSVTSLGDDRAHYLPTMIEEFPIDSPVFEEPDIEDAEDDETQVFKGDSLHPLQDLTRIRRVSRGSSRDSRGSLSSERGSISSVASVAAFLKVRLGRSASLSVPGTDEEVLSTCSVPADHQQPHRTVSLRLPGSRRSSQGSGGNLPTVYVDGSPKHVSPRQGRRKSSLQRALSLLSLNTLMNHEEAKKQHKPVQKILRQPRRRHNTVRGLSGMAIDGANQGAMMMTCPSLQRSHTLYYPTNATIRHTVTAARRTHSLAS